MLNHLTVWAGGAVIRGVPPGPTDEGLFFRRDGFNGWEGIPTRRREEVARAVEHGEHDVAVFLGARVLTLDMWALAKTQTALRNLSQQVVGVGADGKRLTVTVDHQGQTLHARGRVTASEATDQGVRTPRGIRSACQLQFVFADPRKYGEAHRYEGQAVTAFHRGTFPAHPVIEIPSAPSSWTVESPGGVVSVSGATSGGTHRFDMLTGRLTRNGVGMPGALVRGDIWAIPAGAQWEHSLSAAGRVIVADTFI